jgi:hypothetical protein
MALAHPTAAVRPDGDRGHQKNWPNEPPGVDDAGGQPTPGGTRRVLAAISTEGPAMHQPPAASTPMAKFRRCWSSAVMHQPKAKLQQCRYKMTPACTREVGHGPGGSAASAPPELFGQMKVKADAANAQTGGGVERTSEQAHGLAVPMVNAPPAASNTSHIASGLGDISGLFRQFLICPSAQQVQGFIDQGVCSASTASAEPIGQRVHATRQLWGLFPLGSALRVMVATLRLRASCSPPPVPASRPPEV